MREERGTGVGAAGAPGPSATIAWLRPDSQFATMTRGAVLAFAIGAGACAHAPGGDPPLETLFAAERAFARMSVDQGMRAAFLANFADDGMVFWPAPTRLHDAFAGRPPPADPRATTLDWAPAAGGVARSGDLGFTTGPWTRTASAPGAPPGRGIFFSVWRRIEGRWQVVADAGAATSGPVAGALLAPAPRLGPAGSADAAELVAADRSVASAGDYASRFAEDAMFASDAAGVLRGAAAIAARAPTGTGPVTLSPLHAAVAQTGDLGYSYGSFAAEKGKGAYLHLWTRDARGAWRLAVAMHQAYE